MIEDVTQSKGFCEMVVNKDDDEIIGLNDRATCYKLINEISLLQFMNGSSLELGLTTHASFIIRGSNGIRFKS